LRCGPKDLTVATTQSVASFGEPLARHVEKRGSDAPGLLWELRRWRPAHRRFEGRWIAGHNRLVMELRDVVVADTFRVTEFAEVRELVGDTVEARGGEFEPQGVEVERQ
jgi:hypothetical protein